ncbi:MAG: amidohydrolase, partial [Acidobacteriota bacterium]
MRKRSCSAYHAPVSKAAILALLSALGSALPSAGQAEKIEQAVGRFGAEIIKLRQQIHQYPELGNREYKTAELVANHLRELGLEVRTGVAHTGVVAHLVGARPGPVVAVRADMDALPVTEETDYPFKS